MARLILASASPNRRQILERAGIAFDWMVSDADENAEDLAPAELVLELSKRKLEAVLLRCKPEDIVVTADTVVSVDDRILGKPKNAEEAREYLTTLSGRTHVVYTGVNLAYKDRRMSFYQTTDVEFYPISEKQLDRYIESGEWFGKAGAYGIQGPAALFVKGIVGDYNNIFGLPAAQMMREIEILTKE